LQEEKIKEEPSKNIFNGKAFSSLPNNTTEKPENGQIPKKDIEKDLQVKLVPSTDFYYKQRDSKKFFKRILRKERSRRKKSHL